MTEIKSSNDNNAGATCPQILSENKADNTSCDEISEDLTSLPFETIDSPITDKIVLTEHKNGFRMGTDSVLLSKFVKATSREKGVDLGTGSGVIPLLLLSEDKGYEITGIEIQKSLYVLSLHNAKKNGFNSRFKAINGDIRNIKQLYPHEQADFVTLNPPYFKVGSGKQSEGTEKLIARHEMNGDIGDFCAAASHCLKYGGRFYVVFRADRLTELLYAMKENKIEAKHIEFIHKNQTAETVLVCGIKGAKAGLKVTVSETKLVKSKP